MDLIRLIYLLSPLYIHSVNIRLVNIKEGWATIYSDGSVVTAMTIHTETSCLVNLRRFPFDTQTCPVVISLNAWRRYASLQHVYMDTFDEHLHQSPNTEWKNILFSHHVEITTLNESVDIAGQIDVLKLNIEMVRNPAFYVIYLLIPSVLMAFVSVLVFLLPPESGERVGLSITVLLSYTVFLLMVSEVVPRGGSNISLFGKMVQLE